VKPSRDKAFASNLISGANRLTEFRREQMEVATSNGVALDQKRDFCSALSL